MATKTYKIFRDGKERALAGVEYKAAIKFELCVGAVLDAFRESDRSKEQQRFALDSVAALSGIAARSPNRLFEVSDCLDAAKNGNLKDVSETLKRVNSSLAMSFTEHGASLKFMNLLDDAKDVIVCSMTAVLTEERAPVIPAAGAGRYRQFRRMGDREGDHHQEQGQGQGQDERL